MSEQLIRQLAREFVTLDSRNTANEWREKAKDRIEKIQDFLPSGSGFDNGTTVDVANSHLNKIIMYFDFHHMNDDGYYTHWTYHKVTITPDLYTGFQIKITNNGKSQRLEKHTEDFFYESFQNALESMLIAYINDNHQYVYRLDTK